MYSTLNAQLIQANQLELAGRRQIAEHRRVVRGGRDRSTSGLLRLRGLATVTTDVLAATGARLIPSVRDTTGARHAASSRVIHPVGQVGGRRFFRHD